MIKRGGHAKNYTSALAVPLAQKLFLFSQKQYAWQWIILVDPVWTSKMAAAWAAGQAMSMDAVIDYARREVA